MSRGFVLMLVVTAAAAWGQAPASAPEPLVVRQAMARDRMAQFEDQVFRLSERLAASRPAEAERLREALRRSGELLVRQEMQRAGELLARGQTAEAADHQERAAVALDALLALMLAREQAASRPATTTQLSPEQLAELQQMIAQLLARQMELKSRTGQAATRPAELGRLAEQQRELARQTQSSSSQPPGDSRERLARAAEAMKRAAEQLAASRPAGAEPEQAKAIEALSREQRELAREMQQLKDAKEGRPATQPAQGQARPNQRQPSAQAKPQPSNNPSAELRTGRVGGVAPMAPAEQSPAMAGPAGAQSLHAGSAALPGEAWGRMPPQERERIMQSIREGFPPGYQELVEQYYRQLATRPE